MKQEQKKKLAEAKARQEAETQSKANQALIDAIEGLKQAVDGIETNVEVDQTEFVKSITELVESQKNVIAESKKDQDNLAKDLIEQINKIRIPEVKVPKPEVKTIIQKQEDIYAIYKVADSEEDGSTTYYGFTSTLGRWFIMRESGTDRKSYRYAFGTKDYELNWAKKLSLEYKRYGY